MLASLRFGVVVICVALAVSLSSTLALPQGVATSAHSYTPGENEVGVGDPPHAPFRLLLRNGYARNTIPLTFGLPIPVNGTFQESAVPVIRKIAVARALPAPFYGIADVAVPIELRDRDGHPLLPVQLSGTFEGPEGSVAAADFVQAGNQTFARPAPGAALRPGVYTLAVQARVPLLAGVAGIPLPGGVPALTKTVSFSAGFSLGLANINVRRSVIAPGEVAEVTIGVIDAGGSRVTGADVSLAVHAPQSTWHFSTPAIKDNGDGTYTIFFPAAEAGNYTLDATVLNEDQNINASVHAAFLVAEDVPFDIARDFPTVIFLQPTSVTLLLTPREDAANVKVTETVPASFTVSGGDAVASNGATKTITWMLGDLRANQTVPLTYTFNPPNLSPVLHLAGPATVGHAGGSFAESRPWTLAADVVYFLYVKWEFRYNTTAVQGPHIADPQVLCTDGKYNVSVLFMDLADDTDDGDRLSRLQLQPEGEASYTNLPYAGWTHFAGQSNDHTLLSAEVGLNNSCRDGVEDHCLFSNRTLDLTGALNRTYNLRLWTNVSFSSFQDGSNIIATRVINCTNVNLVRDIKVYSPSGEDGSAIRGNIATVAVPIGNYNLTDPLSGSVTVSLFNGTEELNWFIRGNPTKNYTLEKTAVAPNYTERTLVWRFEVPESASAATYTVRAFINHNSTSSTDYTLTKSFTLQDSGDGTNEPVIIFTAAPNVPTCDGNSGPSGQHFKVNVCNYGDYHLTVNVTISPSSLSTTDAPGVIEGETPSISTTDDIQWHNRPLNTSTCFMSAFFIRGSDDIVPASFVTEVVWVDPVTGAQKFISKEDLTDVCGGGINSVHSGSTNPVLSNLFFAPLSEFDVNLFERRGNAGDTIGNVYVIDLTTPPGLNIARENFTRQPDFGYPVGSMYEGFKIRWTFTPDHLSLTGTINTTTLVSGLNFTAGGPSTFAPGGKVFYESLAGHSGLATNGNKARWWVKQKIVATLQDTGLKMARYLRV
ncbi:MAG: hypothetical protein HY520_02640 [Candidatus Aenigmarchaeota archaeon]|nr:hypothetical protein [Candidatus Aenigmarchaeota archaeon]